MKRTLLWGMLSGVMLVFTPGALAEDLPSADDVISRYVKAIGGMEKLKAAKSRRMQGKFVMGGGQMEAPTTLEIERPNKFRVEFTFQGVTGTQAYDGKIGWFVMPFTGKSDPEKMAPDDLKEVEDQSDIDGPLIDYKDKGHKVEMAGKEDSDGAPAYKLKVTKKSGDVESYFIDAEQYMLVKVKGSRSVQGTEVDFEQIFSNYKPVEGVLIAHAIETRGGPMGGGMTMTFDKIETNVAFPADRFTMPEPKKEEPKKEEGEPKKDGADKKPEPAKP